MLLLYAACALLEFALTRRLCDVELVLRCAFATPILAGPQKDAIPNFEGGRGGRGALQTWRCRKG